MARHREVVVDSRARLTSSVQIVYGDSQGGFAMLKAIAVLTLIAVLAILFRADVLLIAIAIVAPIALLCAGLNRVFSRKPEPRRG